MSKPIKYKGKEIDLIKSDDCNGCIFEKINGRCREDESITFEDANLIDPCYMSDIIYKFKKTEEIPPTMSEITAETIAESAYPKSDSAEKVFRNLSVAALALAIECYKDIHVERALNKKPLPAGVRQEFLECNECGWTTTNLVHDNKTCDLLVGGAANCKGTLQFK